MDTTDENNQEQNDWISTLKANPKVQEYFGKYNKSSVERFCENYARFKSQSLQHGDWYREKLDREETEGIDLAMDHLKVIQQKKLFDAQCLWRANQIDFPKIFISTQFKAWEYRVLDCPFIEPVNETDIEWYAEFLSQQNEMPEMNLFASWQDYEDFKSNYRDDEEGDELPDWYDFHNMKTGNGIYLTYPDTRGEAEKYFCKIKYDSDQKSKPIPEKTPAVDEDAGKPYLSGWENEEFLKIAQLVEDKKTLRQMTAYHLGTENRYTWEQERADSAFAYLSAIKGELIPIEANRDFREALHLAVEKHRIGRVVEHLPNALRKYKLMRENGFAFYQEERFDMFTTFQKMANEFNNAIEEGKKLSGE